MSFLTELFPDLCHASRTILVDDCWWGASIRRMCFAENPMHSARPRQSLRSGDRYSRLSVKARRVWGRKESTDHPSSSLASQRPPANSSTPEKTETRADKTSFNVIELGTERRQATTKPKHVYLGLAGWPDGEYKSRKGGPWSRLVVMVTACSGAKGVDTTHEHWY